MIWYLERAKQKEYSWAEKLAGVKDDVKGDVKAGVKAGKRADRKRL